MAPDEETLVEQSDESFSDWYLPVVLGTELAAYTLVRGPIAIRPCYALCENAQAHLDHELKATRTLYSLPSPPLPAFERKRST
jgi:hypothetical protein